MSEENSIQEESEALKNEEGLQSISKDSDEKSNSESQIVKYFKSIFPTVVIGVGSFILVLLLHYFGAFNTLELKLYDFRLKLRGPISGLDANSALPNAEGFVDLSEPFNDNNNNGTWDNSEVYNDENSNNKYDIGESFIDLGNGVWDEDENFVDLDGNGLFDEWDEFEDKGNGKWDAAEKFTDINDNGIWDDKNKIYDLNIDSLNSNGVGCWIEESCKNGSYDIDEEFTDKGNKKWDAEEPFDDQNKNGIWDDAEPFRDENGNNKWDITEPIIDKNGNGTWDDSEVFTDINGNGKWDVAEEFIDNNDNDIWDQNEEFIDIGNNTWDPGEEFIDLDECEKTNLVCHNQKCVEYIECHDINNNDKWDDGLDVVIVERDDESFRLIPDPLPYSRANVWARVVRNLADAGAKIIVFDFVFDKPDHQTKNLKSYMETNELDFPLIDGDEKFIESVKYAESKGAKVILASKIAYEASRFPPTYYLSPYEKLINDDRINLSTGLVNIPTDEDGFNRRYWPLSGAQGDTNLYSTLAIQTVLEYFNIQYDKAVFIGNRKWDEGEKYIDVGDGKWSLSEKFEDKNKNGIWDYGEKFEDVGNGQWDDGEEFVDSGESILFGPKQYSHYPYEQSNDNVYLEINSYGTKGDGFLINFFGPPSGSSSPGDPPYNTFNRISLSNVLDTENYNLGEGTWEPDFQETVYYEDQNWMDNIIGPMASFFAEAGFKNPFKNKIVIIGTSMAEDQDFTLAPYSNYKGEEYQFPGVEFHANAIQHLLDKNFIKTPMGTLNYNIKYSNIHFILIAIFIILTLIFVSKAPPLWGFVIISIETISWVSYSIGSFLNNQLWLYDMIVGNKLIMPGLGESTMIPILFPISAIVLPFGINLTYKLFTEGQDKAFLKASFGSYISPELIDQMYESKSAPSLGGEEGYNTAFFSDIASFSTFSEKLTAPDLVELLNEYLNAMTNILLDNNGTLDKYIGDAIIAFYGAPVELDDHEYLACLTCCQMNDKLEELRQKWKSEGDRWPEVVHNMRHRIGVNCGSLVTGNMGSDMRMNYTMMGDTVNLTARLESGAKQYGIETQVGGKIYETVKDRFTFRMLDYAIVKGRSEPERTYELISEKDKEPEIYNEILPLWEKALELYTNQEWDEAIKTFKKCDKLEEDYIGRPTTPCKVYILRCKEFKENSPGKDWDGAYKLTSK